jgi:hypothetical protein
MGVTPCFDPTTGASGGSQGGGGGGGADLSALGFVEVDLTDGSWTLTDPDDLVDTVSHASGVNTVVMNALAAGSNDYAWSTSTTQRAPRWTRELNAADATGGDVRVTSGDAYILQTVIEYVTPDDDFPAEIVVASAEDGTATTSGTNKAQGGLLIIAASGLPNGGCFTGSSSQKGGVDSNFHQNVSTANHAGGKAQAVAFVNVNSSEVAIAGSSRNSGMTYTNTTTDLNVMVGLGVTGANTITAGQDAKVKVYYRVIVFNLPS